MQGTMLGARRRGRPRIAWIDNIKHGQDSLWKSQSERERTEINGESTSMVWPTLGSRTAKDAKKQNRHKNCNVIFIPRNFGNILVKSVSVCLERFQRYSVCKKSATLGGHIQAACTAACLSLSCSGIIHQW